jgi:hypothetical protein
MIILQEKTKSLRTAAAEVLYQGYIKLKKKTRRCQIDITIENMCHFILISRE